MRKTNYKGISGEALRFVLVGVFATALTYAIYLILQPLGANWAYTIGYMVSFVANFYLSAYYTFREKPSWKRFTGMIGAHVVNYVLQMGLLNAFLWLGVPKVFAPVPTLCIAVPVNFLLVRFIFKSNAGKA